MSGACRSANLREHLAENRWDEAVTPAGAGAFSVGCTYTTCVCNRASAAYYISPAAHERSRWHFENCCPGANRDSNNIVARYCHGSKNKVLHSALCARLVALSLFLPTADGRNL